MTAAQARRATGRSTKMASPAAADMISMFAQRNPKSSRGDVAEVGKLVAGFGATATKLSPAARKRLIARTEQLNRLIAQIAAEPEAASQPLKLIAKAAADVSHAFSKLERAISTTLSVAQALRRASGVAPEKPGLGSRSHSHAARGSPMAATIAATPETGRPSTNCSVGKACLRTPTRSPMTADPRSRYPG